MTAQSAGKRQNRTADGRFLPGHRLGGRPRGVDLRLLVEERAATDPTIGTVENLLWGVVVTLARRAALGDVPAARLLLERLAAPADAPSLDLAEPLSDREAATRIAAILLEAQRRRQIEAEQQTTPATAGNRTLSHAANARSERAEATNSDSEA